MKERSWRERFFLLKGKVVGSQKSNYTIFFYPVVVEIQYEVLQTLGLPFNTGKLAWIGWGPRFFSKVTPKLTK